MTATDSGAEEPSFLEKVWEDREERIYPELFGQIEPGVFTIDPFIFRGFFGHEPDPRWLHVGVLESPPSSQHSDWAYVSSGLSNPWDSLAPPADQKTDSGLGVEFVLSTTRRGSWAVELVQKIAAFELLLAHGFYPGKERLAVGDRVPLRGPLVPEPDCVLTHVLVAPSATQPSEFHLASGHVELVQLIGISEQEAAVGRNFGTEPLFELLRTSNAFQVTDPMRRSLA